MADNFNINTTQDQANEAEGLNQTNPAMTYVDFGNQIVKNAQDQARQAQLVQQAIEQTKQQKLATQQGQEAADLGVNPNLKDVLTIDEAVGLLKAAGIDNDLIQAFVDQVGDKQTVSKAAVDTVIRKKEAQTKFGTPFIASDADAANESLVTKEGDRLVSGQSYYDTGEKDADGNAIYSHGGKEPSDKPSISPQQTEAAWRALDGKMYDVFKVGRGTALTQALMRADRGLNYVANHDYLSPQGQTYVQQDLTGIFQGGVPTQEEMKDTDFGTYAQQINGMIEKWTGRLGAIKWSMATAGQKSEVRNELMNTLMDMRNTITAQLQAMANAKTAGYEEIINSNPERWQRMLKGYEDIGMSSLNPKAKAEMQSMTTPPPPAAAAPAAAPAATTGGPDIHAIAAALGLKKKVAP